MNSRRAASAAGGILALVFALALGGGPASAPVRSLVDILGNDYFVVAMFASVGLLVAASVLYSGREATLQQAETPTPERPVTAPAAGDAVDSALASRTALLPVVGADRRERLRRRLRDAAVETSVRFGERSREAAVERIETGDWTDDPEAAAFLAGRSPGFEARVRALLRAEPWARRGARRAVTAVVEREDDR